MGVLSIAVLVMGNEAGQYLHFAIVVEAHTKTVESLLEALKHVDKASIFEK